MFAEHTQKDTARISSFLKQYVESRAKTDATFDKLHPRADKLGQSTFLIRYQNYRKYALKLSNILVNISSTAQAAKGSPTFPLRMMCGVLLRIKIATILSMFQQTVVVILGLTSPCTSTVEHEIIL